MALFFRPDWAWTTPPRRSSIGPSPHQSGDFQVPLKFETFFYEWEESSYNKLVTDRAAAEGRKHAFNNLHICAEDTVTEEKLN